MLVLYNSHVQLTGLYQHQGVRALMGLPRRIINTDGDYRIDEDGRCPAEWERKGEGV